jgi:hypothetical protein
MRVVLDTSVLVAGWRSRTGASRSRFESALATVPDVPPSNDSDALPVGYRKPVAKKLANKGLNLMGPKKRRG